MTKKPFATAQEVTEANRVFHNAVATNYDKHLEIYHPVVIEYFRRLFQKWIFSHFSVEKQLSVLDVGCGTGYLEQFLIDRSVTVDGIDVSHQMLKLARNKFPSSIYPRFRYRIKDVYTLGEEDKQYDIVLANSFLHHCQDYRQVLEIMGRKVKKGGVLFMGMEPNRFVYKYLFFLVFLFRRLTLSKKDQSQPDGPNGELAEYHLYYGAGFNSRSLRKMLFGFGFTDVRMFSTGRHSLARILDAADINLFPVVPEFLLDHLGPFSPLFHIVAYKD